MALSNDHTENSIIRPRIIHIICLMPGCFWKPNINSVLSFTNSLPTMLVIIIRLSKSKNNLQKNTCYCQKYCLAFRHGRLCAEYFQKDRVQICIFRVGQNFLTSPKILLLCELPLGRTVYKDYRDYLVMP